jgi:hypothetical protein
MYYSDLKLVEQERFLGCFAQQLMTMIQERKSRLMSRIVQFGTPAIETDYLRGQIQELLVLEKALIRLDIKPLDVAPMLDFSTSIHD